MSVAARRVLAYLVALLLGFAGLAVTVALVEPLQGPFFMFQFGAVVGAALFGGLGPGLLTMAVSTIGSFSLFFAPTLESYEANRLASLVLVSVFFASVAARMRRAKAAAEVARARAEAAEAEGRLVGAQQERLVAVVGHDLRNPLNAILVTAEHLHRIGGLPDRHASGLSRIVTSARRMQSMIGDLLDFARARHGSGLPVQRRTVRVGDVCRAALDEVRTAHPSGDLLLDVTGDDSASVDPARVEQLVCNLVTNALQHGAAGAPVNVAVAGEGDAVQIEVTNAGAPISASVLRSLFDPFRPGAATGNVGLGLFIVREIARAHSGEVSVRSDVRGTTFTAVFPKGSTELRAASAGA